MTVSHLGDARRDPYYAAYLFRRLLREDATGVPVDLDAAHDMFEGLEEDDALGLVEDARPHAGGGPVAEVVVDRLRRDSRPRVRAAAALALGEHRQPSSREAILASLHADTSPRVISACLAMWSRLEENIPLQLLRPFLRHGDARVRANATEALIEREVSGVAAIFEVLVNDPAPRVAAAAALGLWRRGRPTLLKLVDREERPAARVAFLWACARSGQDKRVREVLERALEQGTEAEQKMAAYGLPGCSPRRMLGMLAARALRQQDAALRDAMLEGCRKVDPVVTARALERACATGGAATPATARVVANALSALRGQEVEPPLAVVRPHLEAADPRVRANAVELVGDRPDVPSLLPALERALDDRAPRVRANAAVALWRRGATRGMAVLLAWAKDADPHLAASAAWALGRAGGTLGEQALRGLLRDGHEGARSMAYRFLSRAT